MDTHSKTEIMDSATDLADLLRAGIPIADTAKELGELQPGKAEFWNDISSRLRQGAFFSSLITDVWPESIVTAIRAGEESGKLPEVLDEIASAVSIELELRKQLFRLAGPIGIVFAGIGLFLFFMIAIIPMMAGSLASKDQGLLLRASLQLADFTSSHSGPFVIVSMILGASLLWWFKNGAMDTILLWFMRVPYAGDAISSLYFSIWMRYLSLMTNAGSITLERTLRLTASVLPITHQEAAITLANEVESHGVQYAIDHSRYDELDPRHRWPRLFFKSMHRGHITGIYDEAFLASSKSVQSMGLRKFNKFITLASTYSKIVAAVVAISPMGAYFSELGKQMQRFSG